MLRKDVPDMTADSGTPLAIQFIPSYQLEQETVSLATVMHSLVLHARSPLALEIVGTPTQRTFLVRATGSAALCHAETQLRARYPQAQVRPVHDDPFQLLAGETVSALELRQGSASYLPLHLWDEQKQSAAGNDPLVGILAALDSIPAPMRAIAQLALVPAPPTWSQASQRKSIEHALDPERQQQQQQQASPHSGDPVMVPVLILAGFGLVLLLLVASGSSFLPAWIVLAGTQAVQGHWPTLTPSQDFQLYGGGILFCVVFVLLIAGITWVRRCFFGKPLYDMKLVAQKTARMAYHVRVRLCVIGPLAPRAQTPWHTWRARRVCKQQRQDILERLVAAYRQFHLATGNYFVPKTLSVPQSYRYLGVSSGLFRRAGWWQGIARSRQLIDVDALATLWHLPAASLLPELAQVEQRRARSRLIPPLLASLGTGRVPLGTSEHAGHTIPFALPLDCLTRHMLIAGKSGEGKSTCMVHLAVAAMQDGPLFLIDPHGDLAEQVLERVPHHRRDDVVLIDLADQDFVIGLNPLDATMGRGRDKTVSDLLSTLAHIWAASWGSRMEIAFAYALRTLYEANVVLLQDHIEDAVENIPQYTLLDVMPLLTDESFCHALLEKVTDPFLLRWWHLYYDPLSETMQRDRSDPVLSKVAKFESQIARRIVGQSHSTIHFPQQIADQKIILLKLVKGVVGEDVAQLLGATLLGLFQIALEEQAAFEETQRVRFPILVDEFQVLKGVNWASLAELRKYGAAFYLATQSLAYLAQPGEEQLLPTVLANVKQYIIFHLSAADAETIQNELGVEATDIVNLDSYTCYIKLTAAGQRQPAFSARIMAPPEGNIYDAVQIREDCRQRYCRAASTIDPLLEAALIRSLGAVPSSRLERTPLRLSSRSRGVAAPADQEHATPPAETDTGSAGPPSPVMLARQQNDGYRGRKAQRRPSEKTPKKAPSRSGDPDAAPLIEKKVEQI